MAPLGALLPLTSAACCGPRKREISTTTATVISNIPARWTNFIGAIGFPLSAFRFQLLARGGRAASEKVIDYYYSAILQVGSGYRPPAFGSPRKAERRRPIARSRLLLL